MKKNIVFTLIIVLITAVTLMSGCGSSSLSKKEYTIATVSRSGVYYPVGESLSSILKETYPDVKLNVTATDGSVQNLKLLSEGKVDMALVQNDIAFYASQGEKMFSKKITSVTGIATIFPEVVQIVVRKDRGINALADLSSKTIAVGSQDSGTFYNSKQILTIAGVWKSVNKKYVAFPEAIKELESGEIDGLIFTSGIPNPSIVELAKKIDISIVPVSPDIVQKLVNSYSFYFPSTIEAKQYNGQDSEIPAVEINAIMVSGKTLLENDQYLITKALFGKPNDIAKKHPRLSKLTKNSLRRQMPISIRQRGV